MPTTIGHILAGTAAAWTADLIPGRRGWRMAARSASWYRRAGNGLTLTCALVAALPDTDLVFWGHRTATHSVTAVLLLTILAGVVTRQVTRWPVVRVALMFGGAYATHLVLDWLGADTSAPFGLQLGWPFSSAWFLSGWDVFRETTRRHPFSAASISVNLLAVVQELAILAPVLALLWLAREKAFSRLYAGTSGRGRPRVQDTRLDDQLTGPV
jgi:membrane-bound metal-dependent hydrolase YbcI (DUF457 family)